MNLLAAIAPALDAEGLRDIRPPIEIPVLWIWIVLGVWVLIMLAVLVCVWRICRKWKVDAALVPPVPAHVRARLKLQEALAHLSESKLFCTLVSDTVRVYLEESFNFHAPDRTTEEFLQELRGTNLLLPDQKESLGEFLRRCDLVKFARYEPREQELRDLHDSALRLIDETEPQPLPAAGARPPVLAPQSALANS